MNNKVLLSISNRSNVECSYKGMGLRLIEPHILYYSSTGKLLLDAYQISGYSESNEPANWKRFEVDLISSYELLETWFSVRSTFNPNNRNRYQSIIRIVR